MRGRGGFPPPGFRPRLPPPESEETIFKKYDRTPRGDHPSKNHPISKLCEYIRKNGWPVPQWDLINEKIIQQRKNKHGNANIMLYTFKVTIYPGKGQVEPRVYFGSGPTKKDAKFACGSVAWANIEGGVEAKAAAAASEGEARAAGANTGAAPAPNPELDSPPVLDPKAQEYNPMQIAVSAISKMNERVRGMKNKEEWLETVNQNLEHEEKFKRFMELPQELRPPTQLIKREVKPDNAEDCQDQVKVEPKEEEEAEDGEIKEEKKKKRKSRWENTEEETEIKKEKLEQPEQHLESDREKSSGSGGKGSSSRGESSSVDRDSRSRSRKDSHRESEHHQGPDRSGEREKSRSKRDDRSSREDYRSRKSEGRREEDPHHHHHHHDDRKSSHRHGGHQHKRDSPRRDYERDSRSGPRHYDQYGGY